MTRSVKSYRTTARTFRITHTQDVLLDREQSSGKNGSAIVRALLTLYFNGRIPNAAAYIDREIFEAEQAEAARIERSRRKIA